MASNLPFLAKSVRLTYNAFLTFACFAFTFNALAFTLNIADNDLSLLMNILAGTLNLAAIMVFVTAPRPYTS